MKYSIYVTLFPALWEILLINWNNWSENLKFGSLFFILKKMVLWLMNFYLGNCPGHAIVIVFKFLVKNIYLTHSVLKNWIPNLIHS